MNAHSNKVIECRLIEALENAKIDFLINVPATGVSKVYEHFEKKNTCFYVSREEEGVALACGIALSGKLPLLLIQQSGVGNMLNALFGLAYSYRIYFPILVLNRGLTDENPVQVFSSFYTSKIVNAVDTPILLDVNSLTMMSLLKEKIHLKKRWFIITY